MGDPRIKVFGPPAHELFERVRIVVEMVYVDREKRYKDKPNVFQRKWLYEEAVQALDALEILERMMRR